MADCFTTLETPRLTLRRFRPTDLAAFLAYRNDPEVARYQSWESITERPAALFIAEQQSARPGTPGGWFQFAIELRATGALIGDCGLGLTSEDRREAEIGYTLARQYQRQGYATEAVAAVFDYAFTTLGLRRMVAIADVRNTPSIRVMERLGMRRAAHGARRVWFKGGWAEEYRYTLPREEWPGLRHFTT